MTVARKSFSGTAVPSSINGGITNVATTLVLNTTTGWPDGTNGRTPAKIDPGLATEEDITYLTRAGSNVTGVLRGQNGTAASAHSNGAVIIHGWSAGEADEVYQHMSDTEADPHSAKLLNTTRHDLTSRHTAGTVIPTAAPTSSAPGDASATGAGPNLANALHKHARESWGLVGDIVGDTPGSTAAAGATGKVADAGHRHAREAWGLVGDIAASAPSDTALAGATGKVADAGHRHAREAPSGGGFTFPAWTAYTPSWVTSGTAPTIGNGSLVGAYFQNGKFLQFRIVLNIGSTTNVGTGSWFLSMPGGFTLAGAYNFLVEGQIGSTILRGSCDPFLAGSIQPRLPSLTDPPLQLVTNTFPAAWVSGSRLIIFGNGEIS